MKTIIDVGAANIPSLNSEDIYYLFEPEKEAYDRLVKKFKENKKVFISNVGLYNKKETKTLYVATKRECSSLLPPNWEVLKKYNAKRFLTDYTFEIGVDRLDNILPTEIEIIDRLKLDTQGTEYEILEGCGEMLNKVKTITCEVEHIELYKNQKLYQDINEYLKNYGFEFIKWDRQVRWGNDLIFGDAVYINKNV